MMDAKKLEEIQQELNTGIKNLEKDSDTDMVYQQLVDAQQALGRALRGLRNRERQNGGES